MKKLIYSIFFFIIIFITAAVTYLSTIGYETTKFNQLIREEIKEKEPNIEVLINIADIFCAHGVTFIITVVAVGTIHPVFALVHVMWCSAFFIMSHYCSKKAYVLSQQMQGFLLQHSTYLRAIVALQHPYALFPH